MYDLFSLPDIKFPEGFIWGSATAGHQIEGDNIYSRDIIENNGLNQKIIRKYLNKMPTLGKA